ncbi:MAG TPA: ABC transporter ATP-binding protein [Rubricoccaceae bacterium]|jgi:ABC-2 type transport system ATP-binding protein
MTAGAPEPLEVRGVSHTYRGTEVPALEGVTLDVAPGERVALLGPNGSGKTTLFRAISGLLRPDAGTVAVAGHAAGTADARKRLGVVFQTVALDGVLTVAENLRVHAALMGVSRSEVSGRVADALRAVGLTDRAQTRVSTLSGGLARRADLARVLLHRPALLLLDEPTTGLDPTARRELWDALDALRDNGTAQLVATHLLDEAESCNRVVVLDGGRVVADGTPEALTAALGEDALWLDPADDAPGATDALSARLRDEHLDARPVGRRVLVITDEPASLLPALYDMPGVAGATVRRPTLDDVFAARTGGGTLARFP